MALMSKIKGLAPATRKARKKAGGSNVGKYKGVKKFAGPAGGAPKGSFPINTLKRAKSALSYAKKAPKPAGIKKAVYRAFPAMAKRSKAAKKMGLGGKSKK